MDKAEQYKAAMVALAALGDKEYDPVIMSITIKLAQLEKEREAENDNVTPPVDNPRA